MKQQEKMFRETTGKHLASQAVFIVTLLAACLIPVISGSSECGGELTGVFGTVTSPGYPESYPANLTCLWHIAPNLTSTNDTILTLHVKQFRSEDGDGVGDMETLAVYTTDPTNTSSSLTPIRSYRGQVAAHQFVISHTDEVWLQFRSNSSASATGNPHKGFYINYVATGADSPKAEHSKKTGKTITNLYNKPETVSKKSDGQLSVMESRPDASNNDDDGLTGKIIAGVTVPAGVILVAVAIAYGLYRRKHPVRLMIGRSTGEIFNPEYTSPSRSSTLVREDTEDFFKRCSLRAETSDEMPIISSVEEQGTKVECVNEAFQDDESLEEEDRKFRQRKSYLFRNDETNTNQVLNVRPLEEVATCTVEFINETFQDDGELDEEDRKFKQRKSYLFKNDITSIEEMMNVHPVKKAVTSSDKEKKPVCDHQDGEKNEPVCDHQNKEHEPGCDHQDGQEKEPVWDHQDGEKNEPDCDQQDIENEPDCDQKENENEPDCDQKENENEPDCDLQENENEPDCDQQENENEPDYDQQENENEPDSDQQEQKNEPDCD